MDEGSPDIITKYHKLAAEYSKLRAQAVVLKKAVSEEQGKNHELKEALKEKDQSTRKLQQEIECLTFRNDQLIKRVSVLQNDLEATEDKLRKSKNKVPNNVPVTSDTQSILNSELLSRIEENERLHQQVFESEAEHKKAVSELTEKVEKLQLELNVQNTSLNEVIEKHEQTIDKLTQERAKIELSLKNAEKEMKDAKLKNDMCNAELQFVKQDLGSKLTDATEIIQEKVTLNDTRWPSLNSLNVPVLLHQKQNLLSAMIVELKGMVSEVVHRLSDLHTYMEQKIYLLNPNCDIDPNCSPLNKFAGFLRENTQYLKSIEIQFVEFVDKIQKDSSSWLDSSLLDGISEAFSKYVRYLDKLLPYLLLSVQTEDSVQGTTPRLKEIYRKLQIVSRSLIVSFSKLERYTQLLVGTHAKHSSYCISRPVLIKKLIASLLSVNLQFEEARKVYGAKVGIDHSLPTLTEQMKTTDECILSSMISAAAGLKKIATLLEERLIILDTVVPYKPRGLRNDDKFFVNACVPLLRGRTLKYLSLLQMEEMPSVPYELAIKNSQTLSTYADGRENLQQQLQACQTKLSKLELEKEHWMLECQLLKAKQLRTSLSSESEDSDSSPNDDQSFHSFVKANVNQLVTQIQLVDSKALAFQNECECLHQKLKLSERRKDTLEQEVASANETVSSLKEEQQSLMKNYEDQLSMMSEHLATMNETLTLQKDEIDALRHAGNKISKKNRGK